jgi:hypothetical protein
MSTSKNRRYDDNNNNSIYEIDERLREELKSSLYSILQKKKRELKKLKDFTTLIDCYKKTIYHKHQIE